MIFENPGQPALRDAELSALEMFLDEQAERGDAMPLSVAHGFLTAVISGPELIVPSEWMPVIWGHPEFEDEEQAQHMIGLIMRLYNDVAQSLSQTGTFRPIFEEWTQDDGEDLIVADNWCRGYITGIGMAVELWEPHLEDELAELLAPIGMLAEPDTPEEQALYEDPESYATVCDMLPGVAEDIYQFWLAHRMPLPGESPHHETYERGAPKIGRNDPCPCGSGEKYKHCCGRPGTLH